MGVNLCGDSRRHSAKSNRRRSVFVLATKSIKARLATFASWVMIRPRYETRPALNAGYL